MKHKIFLFLFLFGAVFARAQSVTVESISIFSRDIDTVFCNADTITRAFFEVTKTTVTNATSFPDVSIDTVLIQNGGCPADSLEILRRLFRDATEIKNRAANAVSNAFQYARRDDATYMKIRTLYNDFSGSEMWLRAEEAWANTWEGVYRIRDAQQDIVVIATLKRLGPLNRYRLEINPGQTGAGTRYAVIPETNGNSFKIVNWNGANYELFKDNKSDFLFPVYRQAEYISGADFLTIAKIR